MRRLELVEGTASKFWQVEQAGSDLNLQWGRIGTAGQSQTKTFSDEAAAAAALATLVAGKLKKGYAEVAVADVIGPAPTTSTAGKKPAPAKSAAAPAAPPVVESLDDQADRAVVALCAAIAAGEVGPSSAVTPALTRRLAGGGINDHAAKIALERLDSLGVVVSYWSGSYRLPEQASETARQALVNLERQKAEPPAMVVPAPQAAPSTAPGDVPPWLAGGRPIRLTPEMRALVYPSRRVPGTLQPTSIDEAWQRIRTVVAAYGSLDQTRGDATYSADAQRLTDRLARQEVPAPDRALDAMLVVLTLTVDERFGNTGRAVVDYLLANHGLLGALDVWLAAQRLHVATTWTGKKSYCWFDEAVDPWPLCWDYSGCFGSGEETLRGHLAAASEEEWRVARDAIVAALPSIHPRRRPALAMLLPDAPEVSDSLALGPDLPEAAHYLLLTATDPAAIAALTKVKLDWHLSVWERREFTYTLLAERGLDAVEVLALHAEHDAAGEALACIGTPEAVAALARVATSSKGALANLTLAVDRWPLAAVAALARQVALGAKADVLMPLLAGLLRAHDVTEVRPWLEPAAAAVVDRQLALLAGPTEVAAVADLPPVLAAPPWLAKTKKTAAAALILEPLPIAPVECWDAGVRERAAQDDQWQQQRRDAAARDVLTLVRHLGFDADKQHLVPLGEAAARAIRHRDTDALVAQWRAMVTARKEHRYWWYRFDASSVSLLPQPMAAPFWNAVAGETETGGVTALMAVLGVDGLPGLVSMVRAKPTDHLPLARSFGAVELAPLVARAFAKLKTARQPAQDWLLRYPEHAAAGLVAPALGKAGEAHDCAGVALRFLAAQGHEALIVEVAGRYGREDVSAGLRAVLDENPLDRFPTRRARLPEFWQPAAWHRPVLHDGKALPDSALDALGQMLTFPTTEGVYAGIDQVKQACTPGSLADFAWDLFSAWLAASAPAKEGWVLSALGLLGDDDTARRLTPYIRAWPGESAHARAVNALDVLATIGTDVALMQLNGIAQKLKFKGLQDKAREKITAIAEDRELTLEELDDRLAPDLGLDERGTMLLDFGPRVFTVGFDESLRPYVRQVVDGVPGPRLANLPKPRQSDDPELAKAATTAFRTLKKDARTIASQQVLRLETAMCTQRRWTPDLFETFLVDHPLVRHLVQRLLWGVYRTTASHGGDLLGLFRVAEDGSFTTADDDPYEIPAGDDIRVGIPHALAITDADAAAFGQLFADYELMQPFAQIGRDTYTLTDAERLGSQLLRWKDVTVPTGRVLGLVNKGWRRGEAQDGGGIWYFTKPLDGGRVVELDLDPGIIVGMVDEYPEQVLGKVQVGRASEWGEMRDPEPFSTLDAVAASELVRDMEALTAP